MKKRKQIRLGGYDYSLSGYYFATICTQDRECILGNIVNGKMKINNIGKMVDKFWLKLPKRFDNIELNEYQIMPNHLHGIIRIVGAPLVGARPNRAGIKPASRAGIKPASRAGIKPAPTALGDIIGAFKSLTTYEYIRNVKNNRWPSFNKRVWQRNYYERIIRNEKSLNKIRQYITLNPTMWDRDRNNLEKI